MTDQPESRQPTVLYLKYWHIVLMLIVQLVGLGVMYGSMRQSIDDLRDDTNRRLAAIENSRFITRDEFDDFKSDITQRLDRIESDVLSLKK